MLLFIILKLLFINYLNIVNGVVVDMSTGTNLAAGRNWLEIGFTSITDRSWTSITTVGSTYVDPIILIGLPENGGPLYTQGTPLATRIRNVVKLGTVSFQVKLYQPNDSFCAKTWYVPVPITTPISTSWCVVEKGSFNISSNTQWAQFTINTGLVNRTTATIQIWNFEVPRTCIIGGVPNSQCLFAVPDPVVNFVGAVATLQTLVYDTYLLLRTSRIRRRDLTLVLTPHDSTNAAYFNFPISETAGFMMFLTGRTISCIEKLAFETRRFGSITSNKFSYKYTWQYARVPGIFGHITTQVSATDSTALRIFGRNLTTTFIITQEDYCDSADPIHTASETASILVVGELASVGNVVCGVIYTGPTDAPTFAPSRSPTYKPSTLPSTSPTYLPSSLPTSAPSSFPTYKPSSLPTYVPSSSPTSAPSTSPTYAPSSSPTSAPSSPPTYTPSSPPTYIPSSSPTYVPSSPPTYIPSSSPTAAPSSPPTYIPSSNPTYVPSSPPTYVPSSSPTTAPSSPPTYVPSSPPTYIPSSSPTYVPSSPPTAFPTSNPTYVPSVNPTYVPSSPPTCAPTEYPTGGPTRYPTYKPSSLPSSPPTYAPSYVPSSSPTYVPSSPPTAFPTSNPTYVPSNSPTYVPSSFPTYKPSSSPTYAPSITPSVSPTISPTSSPTSLPTLSPTRTPSTISYLVRVYAYTSFGGVWDNLKFAVQSSDGSFDYSFASTCNCSNSFAFYVPMYSTFNISIQAVDPTKPVRHSWESFFKYIDPNTGKSYFGQLGSTIQIVDSQVVATTNLLNMSTYSDDTGCHRCRHPPPPSKGKDDDNNKNNDNNDNDSKPTPIKHKSNRYLSINLQNESDSNSNPNPGDNKDNRPKRPPLEYPFALFDADGDGWYKEGYDEICPGNPNSLWPSALTYPRYNIISGDRTTVIHQGTICGAFSMEACQEVLPYDGKFVFRVTGYDENPSSVSWNFCGVDGILGQELDFEMVKGKCIPGSKRNTGDFCQGIQSLSIWSGSLLVSSTSTLSSDSITIEDSKALEKAISVVLFNSEVHIESLEVNENELTVYFTSTIILENVGYVGLYSDELEAGEEYLTTSMENAVTNGVVYASIQHIIHSDPTLASGIISHAKSVSLLSFEMTSLSFQTKVSADNGGSSWNPSQGNNNNNNNNNNGDNNENNNNNQEKSGDENQSIEELTHISYIGYISGVLAVIFVGLLVIVITRNRSNKNSQVNQSNKTLTDESVHPFNSSSHSLIDNSGRQFEQMENSPRTKYVNDEVFRFR